MKSRWHYLLGRILTLRNWYLFVPPFSRIWKTNRIATMWNGVRFEMRDIGGSDFFIFMEIAWENIYKLERIRNPKVVLDLGANIGIFSLIVAKKFPCATVYAVEPEEGNYRQLLKNIRLSNLKNIVPIYAAIGTEKGKTTLYIDETNHGTHSTLPFKAKRTQQVDVITFADIPPFDVLKCDIEGAEYEIFKKAPSCNYIGIEVHGEDREARKEFLSRFPLYSKEEGDHNSFVMQPRQECVSLQMRHWTQKPLRMEGMCTETRYWCRWGWRALRRVAQVLQ